MEIEDQGAQTTPPVVTVPEVTPPASEGVTTPADPKEQFVPYSRFQEVNDRAKEARQQAEAVSAELNSFKEAMASIGRPAPAEPTLAADSEAALAAYLDKGGFVRKADMERETAAQRAATDLQTLKAEKSLTDEQLEQVRTAAVEMGAANKRGLEAAYTQIFMDKILEDKVKEALAGKTPTGAEKPGAGAPPSPGTNSGDKPMSLKDRVRASAANHIK